jgi:hypothetical protein
MPVSTSLSRKLREALGADAGGDLVTWLEEQREESAHLRGDMAELRQQISSVKVELKAEMLGLEGRLAARIAHAKSDLMKWSFVFWCGAVASIAALAGLFR